MRLRVEWVILVAITAVTACGVQASVVKFETVVGDVYVQLYDETTPNTVTNFLNYVNTGDYNQSFIHRSVPGFVVQGGGYTWLSDQEGVGAVPSDPPVINEPTHSNTRGTIAMAKIGGDPDSATNQWFFNVEDNSENLDNQNGGFTVFGHVIGDGMDVIDTISTMMRVNAGSPFDNLPVRDWDQQSSILVDNLIMVNQVLECKPGDINCDGNVGLLDLDIMGQHYKMQDATWLEGDLNNDGKVTLLDLDILGDAYGKPLEVPEPGTLAGLLISTIMCIRREKYRKNNAK